MSIEVRHLSKRFDDFVAINDVSLKFPNGGLTALLGPSGCGKTTLLRIIAGLEHADSGMVLLDGEDASPRRVRERHVGFVFQHYVLFKHMTVFENIAFGLRVKPRGQRPPERAIHERVTQLLDLVQLDWLANHYPSSLSGGQRQRIALARALAVEPRVLLLDEPFGALDAKVRKDLRRWLRRLHDELDITSIFVTHDQEEALEVADQVVVMNKGTIEQIGTPTDVYNHPASPFVYSFLGNVNLFRGRIHNGVLEAGSASFSVPDHALADNVQGIGYVRPHDLDVQRCRPGESGIVAQLHHTHAIGPLAQLELVREDNHEIVVAVIPIKQFREMAFKVGERLLVSPHQLRVFVAEAA